jgi:hypothetical protein
MDQVSQLMEAMLQSNPDLAARMSPRFLRARDDSDVSTVHSAHSDTSTIGSIKSISTITNLRNTRFGFAFDRALQQTRVYTRAIKGNIISGPSVESLVTTQSKWSQLTGLSLSEISCIAVVCLPVRATELYNSTPYLNPLPEIKEVQQIPQITLRPLWDAGSTKALLGTNNSSLNLGPGSVLLDPGAGSVSGIDSTADSSEEIEFFQPNSYINRDGLSDHTSILKKLRSRTTLWPRGNLEILKEQILDYYEQPRSFRRSRTAKDQDQSRDAIRAQVAQKVIEAIEEAIQTNNSNLFSSPDPSEYIADAPIRYEPPALSSFHERLSNPAQHNTTRYYTGQHDPNQYYDEESTSIRQPSLQGGINPRGQYIEAMESPAIRQDQAQKAPQYVRTPGITLRLPFQSEDEYVRTPGITLRLPFQSEDEFTIHSPNDNADYEDNDSDSAFEFEPRVDVDVYSKPPTHAPGGVSPSVYVPEDTVSPVDPPGICKYPEAVPTSPKAIVVWDPTGSQTYTELLETNHDIHWQTSSPPSRPSSVKSLPLPEASGPQDASPQDLGGQDDDTLLEYTSNNGDEDSLSGYDVADNDGDADPDEHFKFCVPDVLPSLDLPESMEFHLGTLVQHLSRQTSAMFEDLLPTELTPNALSRQPKPSNEELSAVESGTVASSDELCASEIGHNNGKLKMDLSSHSRVDSGVSF